MATTSHNLLHKPEIYQQWFNLCNLYPEKVNPNWIDPTRVSLEEDITTRCLEFQVSSSVRLFGYGRMLYDFYFRKVSGPDIHLGIPTLGGRYGKGTYNYYSGGGKCYLLPRPQACIAGYAVPSQKLNGVPADQNSTAITASKRYRNEVAYLREVDEETDKFYQPKREKFNSASLQHEDSEMLTQFDFSVDTLQLICLPEFMTENSSRPVVPKHSRDTKDRRPPLKIFSEVYPYTERNIKHRPVAMSLTDGWHVSVDIPALGGLVVLPPEHIKHEFEVDSRPMLSVPKMEKLLAKGYSINQISAISEKHAGDLDRFDLRTIKEIEL